MLSSRDHLIEKDIHRLQVKGWGKAYHAHGLSKKAEVSILLRDKTDFKPKLVARDKGGHFILLKESINQQNIIIINIYVHVHPCTLNKSFSIPGSK